jgi:hypothetical protein
MKEAKLLLILLAVITFLFACQKNSGNTVDTTLPPQTAYDSFCIVKPSNWTCRIYQEGFDTLPKVEAVEKPLAVLKFEEPTKTLTFFSTLTIKPSLFLYVYDVSKRDTLEKIIKKQSIFSSCIPMFYGENAKYYVITSPCYINSGDFSTQANELIKPLHLSFKKVFTRTAF